MPYCSIVVRTYNEEQHIGRLLSGLTQQTISDYEIILVDSGSTDATLSIASQYPVSIIHISPAEFTFGRSLNLGISKASSEFIVIASAHVYPVYPDWLEQLLSVFSNPRVAVSYGKQRGGGTTKISEHQLFAKWFPEKSCYHQTHPFCNNANAAIRYSLWQQHSFDETLSGLEDLEWSNWAMQNGYLVSYQAEAEVIHLHDETPHKVYNRYRREAMAFKRIYPHEHFRIWDLIRLFVTNVVSDIWYAARKNLLGQSLISIIWFRWMQFLGTYQGYRYQGPLTAQLRQTFYYPRRLFSESETSSRNILPISYSDVKERIWPKS